MRLENIEDIGLLFGLFLFILMAIGQLLLKKKDYRNYLVITILLLASVVQFYTSFHVFSGIDNWHAMYLYVYTAGIVSLLCILPFVYILFIDHIKPGFSKNRKILFHFIIPFLTGVVLFFFIDYLPNTTVAPGKYKTFLYNHNPVIRFISVFSILYLFFYFFMVIFKYQKQYPKAHDKHRRNLSLVLSLSFLTLILGSLFLFYYKDVGVVGGIYKLRFTILAVFIFLTSYANPFLLNIRKLEFYRDGYEKSYIGKINMADTVASLEMLMDRDHLFLEENLTIKTVAEKLGITRHQLSEILNRNINKSFSQYINEKRLDLAKRQLMDNPSKKILAVAMDCGYGTISNFNSSFRKRFGMAPGEYRKSAILKRE